MQVVSYAGLHVCQLFLSVFVYCKSPKYQCITVHLQVLSGRGHHTLTNVLGPQFIAK